MGKYAIIASILLLSACGSTKTVTYTYQEESGVQTEETEVNVNRRPPRVRPIDRAGDRISQPVSITEYREEVELPKEIEAEPVYEVEIDGQYATFKSLHREIQVLLPAVGEQKTVRFDSSGTVQERVDGTPEDQEIQEVVDRDRGSIQRVSRAIFAGPIRLILALGGVVLLALLTYLAIRFMPKKQ